MPTNAELINSILADTMLRNAPATPQIPNITPEQAAAYFTEGKKRVANKDALNQEESDLYQQELSKNPSLMEQMLMGAGAQEYANQSRAMDGSGPLDYLRTAAAGAASGFVSTLGGPAAMAAGAQADLANASVNSALERAGYTPVAHNYMGEFTSAVNDFSNETLPQWIQSDSQTELDKASNIRREVRAEADKLQYKKDLENGMSEESAGLLDFFRSMATGIENITDTAGGFIKQSAQTGGQLVGQGLAMKGTSAITGLATQNAAKTALRAAARAEARIQARKITDQAARKRVIQAALKLEQNLANKRVKREAAAMQAAMLFGTEAAASVGETAKKIDNTNSTDLYAKSPVYRSAYNEYISRGLSPEEADEQARTEAKMVAAYVEAGFGGASAMIASRAARPIAKGMGSDKLFDAIIDSASEGLEEAITGFGQGIGGNIAAKLTVDQDQRYFEGVGAQVTEGAIAGAASSGVLRAPGAAVNTVSTAIKEANATREAKLKEAMRSNAQNAQNAKSVGSGTITEGAEDGTNDVKTSKFSLVENTDGTKSIQTDDNYFNDLFYDSDENIASTGVDVEGMKAEGKSVDITDSFKALYSKLRAQIDSKDLDGAGKTAQEYINAYDAWKKRVGAKYSLIDKVQGQLNSVGTKDHPATQLSTPLFEDILRDVMSGGNGAEIIKKRAKTPDEKAVSQLVAQNLIELRNNRATAQNAIDYLAKVNAADIAQGKATPAQVNAMAQKAAEGTLDAAQVKAYSAYANKNREKLREDEKRLKAILDMQSEIEQRLPTIKNANVAAVAENVHRTSKDSRKATKDIISGINKGIANNDIEAIKSGLARLNWFAQSQLNKLNAMQKQLKNNDFNTASFEAHSSMDGTPISGTISYRSPNTYNELFQETQDLANLYNKYSEVLSGLGISLKDNGLSETRTVPQRLENEKELMDTFYNTHREEYKQDRNKRKSEQSKQSTSTSNSNQPININININGQSVTATTGTQSTNTNTQTTETTATQNTETNTQTTETTESTNTSETNAEASSNDVETQQQEQSTNTQQETNEAENTVSEAIEEVSEPEVKEDTSIQENTSTQEETPKESTTPTTDSSVVLRGTAREAQNQVQNNSPVNTQEALNALNTNQSMDISSSYTGSMDSNYRTEDYLHDQSNSTDISGYIDESQAVDSMTALAALSPEDQQVVDEATQAGYVGSTSRGKSHVEGYTVQRESEFVPATDADAKAGGEPYNINKRDAAFREVVNAWNNYNKLKTELESMDRSQALEGVLVTDAAEVQNAVRTAYEAKVKEVEEAGELAAKMTNDFSRKYRIPFKKELLLRGEELENFYKLIATNDYSVRKQTRQKLLERDLKEVGIVRGEYIPNTFLGSLGKVAKDTFSFLKNVIQQTNSSGDLRTKYNNFNQSMIAYLFKRSKNQTVLDNLTLRDRVKVLTISANNENSSYLAKEVENDPFLKEIFKNDTDSSIKDLNEQDAQHIQLFMDEFGDFMSKLLQPKKKKNADGTVENADSLNFGLVELIQDGIAKGKSLAEIITGISLNPDTKELDGSTISDNYLLALLTYMDKQGNIKWNAEFQDALALATLIAIQELESSTSIETQDKFDWTQLAQAYPGIDMDKLQAVLPVGLSNQIKASTPLSAIIDSITRNTMDLLGVQNDPSQPINLNGQRVLTNASALAARYAMSTGSVVRKEIIIDTNSDGKGTYKILKELPGKERSNSRYKVIPIYLPATSLTKDQKKKQELSQQFQSPLMAKNFNSILMHERPDKVAFSDQNLPKPGEHKLRSQANLTKAEKAALKARSKVKYSVIPRMLAFMKFTGKEGILRLNGIDPDDTNVYNVVTQDNIDGRITNLEMDFDNVDRLGQQAIAANIDDPAIYFGGTMNASGRYQEQAALSTQSSKLARAIFSNVNEDISIDGTAPEAVNAFKRAILQQFGFKIKRLDDTDIDAAFNKLLTNEVINAKLDAAIQRAKAKAEDVSQISDLVFQDLFMTSKDGMENFIVNMENALGESRENGSLALGVVNSFLNYMVAQKTGQSTFLNTLYVEGDGSCNGDFNSALLHLADGPITAKDILKFYQSQMFLGILQIDSKEGWKYHPQDNYTANAVEASKNLLSVNNFAKSLNVPSIKVGNQEITPQRLADNTLGVIATILGKDFSLNWEALNEGRNDAISLARSVLKGPTTRINYEQGRTSNTNNIFNDINKKLAQRFDDVINNPNMPIYEAFFKQEISSGQMTEAQAFERYNQLATGWQIISSAYLYEDTKNGTGFHIYGSKDTKSRKPTPILFPLKQMGIKASAEYRQRLQAFRLNPTTVTYQFKQNVERFYATPIYDAVQNNKTKGYRKYLESVREWSNFAATLQQTALNKYLKDYSAEHNGFEPSQNEINAYKQELEKLFPTTLRSDTAELSLVNSERVALPDYKIKTRHLTNLKVRGTDTPVQYEINVGVDVSMPAPSGVSSAPKMTIAGGDGTMQTLIANDSKFQKILPNVADRYDGTEMSPNVAKEASYTINKAAFNVIKHNMAPSFLNNVETIGKNLDEYAKKVPEIKEFLDNYIEEHFGIAKEDIVSYNEVFNGKVVPVVQEQVESITLNSLVMQTMPVTMEHMSLGTGGYSQKDPRDTFTVTPELLAQGIDVANQVVADEFNRRRLFILEHPEILENYKKTGKINLPDAFFENETAEAQETLVEARANELKRILNTTPADRTIPADQLLPPRTTTVQPQATVTSTNRTGRLNTKFQDTIKSYIGNLAKNNDFEARALKAFFTKFINDNLANNVKIVHSKNPKDFNKPGINANTPAYYDPNTRKIVINDAVLSNAAKTQNKSYEEVLAHELVHAIINLRIDEAYKNKKHPSHKDVLRLEKIMDEAGKYLETNNPVLYRTLSDAIFKNADKAAAINEFVAYMLTNPQLIKALEGKKTSTKSSVMKHLINAFKALMQKIFKMQKGDWERFKTFYGDTLLTVTEIVRVPETNPIAEASSKVASAANKGQQSKVKGYATFISDEALKGAMKRSYISPTEQLKAKDRASAYNALISDFTDNVGIPLASRDRIVAGILAELYNNAMVGNSSIRLDAENLRREIVGKLKVQDFKLPNDGESLALAQKRYDFFTGKSNKNSISENSDALGIFMALSAVSPEIREILNKASNRVSRRSLTTNPEVYASESIIDKTLSNFGERALQEVTNIIDRPVMGNKVTTNLIDQLNHSLLEASKTIDLLSTPSSLLNKADEAIANAGDRVGTAFITSDMLTKMLHSDSKFVSALASSLKISTTFLLKNTNELYINNKKLIQEAVNKYAKNNPSFMSRFFTTAYKELMSSDKNADIVYETEKRAKAAIQAVRSNWRDVTPRVIKEQFTKEGVNLTQEQSASLDTAILKSDLGTLTEKQIDTLMKSSLDKVLADAKGRVSYKARAKAEALAHYMTTGEASPNMLRNADAIVRFLKTDDTIQDVDNYITLLVLKENEADFKVLKEIYSKAPKATKATIAQQREIKMIEEKKRDDFPDHRYNTYKGYYAQSNMTLSDVKVVDKDALPMYKSLGYKVIGNVASDAGKVYVQNSVAPNISFNQGGLQTVINQVGGIDSYTGWSSNDKVSKRIKNPYTVGKIKNSITAKDESTPAKEAYIPILDETGTKIVGYELTVNPDMYTSVIKERDFARNLGIWRGRQVEEELATDLNKTFIEQLQSMYDNATEMERKNEYVDVISLAQRDPVIAKALQNIPPSTRVFLSGSNQLPTQWFIRNDLVDDVLGRKQASVVDLETGQTRWSPKARRAITEAVKTVLGPKGVYYLFRAEAFTKATTASARNIIVVRSGIVPALNIAANVMSLAIRGVPMPMIATVAPRIVKELENYNHSRQRQIKIQIELNAERGKDRPNQRRIDALETKLREEQALVDRLLYTKDLLKAGEYNTVADIGDTNDDILLTTGKFGEYLEKQVNKLPDVVKETARQGMITKDTALYAALEKSTRYGDFVAKALLYHHLINKKGISKEEALSKVRYEFVNYDMLAGRTREYLENIGLLWFYNYKLRIARTAMSMIKENPLSSLLSMVSPMALGIGTPITDSFIPKLATNPFASIGPKVLDLPWLSSNLWSKMFF